jgi:hypothetical protein
MAIENLRPFYQNILICNFEYLYFLTECQNKMVRGWSKVVQASGCVHCRLSLLRTFTSISSLQWHATQERLRAPKPSVKNQLRFFSGAQWHATEQSTHRGESEQTHNNDGGDEVSDWKGETSSSTPWYLQVDRPMKHPQPLSERQRIPELPEFSPDILQPLLQHISIDLGLDDLSLLDLRNLDPPPALGSNLLMIIGTARSEKHLHVSADRLCRWLRSEYKLRPDADGLLGRNELKLKMKRKNRRAKLLGNGPAEDDIDDGIRTGWVCVNLGMVPGVSGLEKVRTEKEGFVGFGRQSDGTKIVIQMLVEEKREELDLEKLWNGIKKRQMLSNTNPGEEKIDGAGRHSDNFPNISSESSGKPPSFSRPQTTTSAPPAFIQSRGLHTSSRRLVAALQPSHSTLTSPLAIEPMTYHSGQNGLESYLQELIPFLKSGDYGSALGLVKDPSAMADLQNDNCKEYIFSHLRTRLESIPAQQAMEEFGRDYMDYSSTPFLCFIYEILSNIPSARDWEFRLWLCCFARKLGHSGYPAAGLSILFEQLQLSGTEISRDMYLLVLRGALRTCGNSPDALASVPDSSQLKLALKVFQDMYNRTGSLLTEDVFVALQESLATFPVPSSDLAKNFIILPNAAVRTCDLPVLKRSGIQSRLTTLMSALQVRIGTDESRIRLMTIFAKQYDWVAFWEIWRSVARDGKPRSAALYECMFRRVTETNHQKGCMNVLRTWIPEMDREEPQVMLQGEVLDAVQACLAVANPSVEIDRINDPEAQGEWLDLWRRCLTGSL